MLPYMKSMTGFGRASRVLNDFEITIEVASLNSKKLEINLGAPRDWTSLEQDIYNATRDTIERGKLKVNVNVKTPTTQATSADLEKFEESIAQLKNFAEACQLEFKPDSLTIWQIANQAMRQSELPDYESTRDDIIGCYREALAQLVNMRENEGLRLKADIQARLKLLSKYLEEIQTYAPQVAPYHRDQLLKRLEQLDLDMKSDDDRVIKEASFYADRCDITEEITRLKSHFVQFQQFLDSDQAIGRKIDFLIQEINREVNTIGSKANFLEITQLVVEAKNELERIREQIQNIE